MKTIKDRAKAYAKKIWAGGKRDWATAQKMSEHDFIAGAKSEREELLRWHDPHNELPEQNKLVLLKTDEGIYTGSWWGGIEFGVYGNGFSRGLIRDKIKESEDDGYTCRIISWRHIHEL